MPSGIDLPPTHVLASPSLARQTAAHVREQDFDWAGVFAQEATLSVGERPVASSAADCGFRAGLASITRG